MQISRQLTHYLPTITFWGAAHAVTGSMHLIEWADERILLDCGLALGWNAEAQRRNRSFPFVPASISAVVLSHAHIDHSGNLPNLVRQGFRGPIFCTPATRELIAVMLVDSARIHEEEAKLASIIGFGASCTAGALYSGDDVQRTLAQCVAVPYQQAIEIRHGVLLRFADAGHLLGSAMASLTFDGPDKECRITYTGDLGRPSLGFLQPPAPIPAADLVICESTYGGRLHPPLGETSAKLQQVVRATIERNGKVLIPAFSLGRAQLVVHYLRRWMSEAKLPGVPIYVDSALAADIADIHEYFPENLETINVLAERLDSYSQVNHAPPIRYFRGASESRALGRRREPCILVASGGMCEAGRILNHFEHGLDDPRNSVLLVSYQAPGSLGRKLLERGPTVSFRGRRWNKWADIVALDGFSGHADQRDLLESLRPLVDENPSIRLVHGELSQAEALASALRLEGFTDVDIPHREDSFRMS